jgi:uncharacterized DUF497 family protein
VISLFTSGMDYLEIFDADDSDEEERFICIGRIARGIVLVVVVDVNTDLIRYRGFRDPAVAGGTAEGAVIAAVVILGCIESARSVELEPGWWNGTRAGRGLGVRSAAARRSRG